MARKFAPMYCSLNAISGFADEKLRAERILTGHMRSSAAIVLLAVEDQDWVYGQCSFPYPDENEKPLKFLERFTTLVTNKALDLLTDGRSAAILFVDADLKQRFERHKAFERVKPLFRMVVDLRAAPSSSGFFGAIGRAAKALISDEALAPRLVRDEVKDALEALEIYTQGLRNEADLFEVFQWGCFFHHYCALDTYLAELQARADSAPRDVVAQTALAVVLTDFGDHKGALPYAHAAIKLPNAPPEALLYAAKLGWWAGDSGEALDLLRRITSFPKAWPLSVRSSVCALRGALHSQQGDHSAAAIALQEAIDIEGSAVELHICLAHELVETGDFGSARAAIDAATVLRPDSPIIQAERCRILTALGEEEALLRALRRLCQSDSGRLEARRFVESEAIEGVGAPLPDEFLEFDRRRMRVLSAGMLPNWMRFCEGSLVWTTMNLYLQDAHRGDKDYGKSLSPGFRSLMADRFDASAHASLAATWHLMKRPEIAVDWARAAVALKPDSDRYHWLLASILEAAGQPSESFDVAEFAIEIGKADEDLKRLYSKLFWSIPRLDRMATMGTYDAGRGALQRGAEARLSDPELRPAALFALSMAVLADDGLRALELQREAVSLQPDRDAFHSVLVQTLRSMGREGELAAALEDQATALRRNMPSMTALHFSAVASNLLDQSQHDTAVKFVRAGLQLDPNLPDLRLARARVALSEGRSGDAIDELREIAFSDSECAPKAAEELADALSESERREEALIAWARLRDLRPGYAEGFLGAGIDLWMLDRDAEAAEMVARAVTLHDSDPYAWGLLGRVLHALGRTDQALRALERALGFEHPPRRALLSLAMVLIAMGRSEDALVRCESVLARDPDNAEAAIGRVEALAATGSTDAALGMALAWIASSSAAASDVLRMLEGVEERIGPKASAAIGEVALVRHPKDPGLLEQQAYALMALGRFEKALLLSRRAVELAPTSAAALRCYAHVSSYREDLEPDEARSLVDRLLAQDTGATTLTSAGEVLRAANLEAHSMFTAAIDAEEAKATPNHHRIAWCSLHVGRLMDAVYHMDQESAARNPGSEASIDAALVRFLTSDGGPEAEQALAHAFGIARRSERGAGYLRETLIVASQLRRQGVVGPAVRLDQAARLLGAVAYSSESSDLPP